MSLKRQAVWSLVPILAVTAINLVSVPLFYRFLGAQLYALWFYVLTFTGAFGFMDLGLGVAVGRYIGIALGKNDPEAVREYWGTGNALAIPLLAIMGLAFAIVGALFGPKWFNVDPSLTTLLRYSFIAGGLSVFLSYYGQFWLILSQAHLDFKFISIVRTVASLLQIIPSIVLAWATQNPFILILWSAIVGVLQLVAFIWHANQSYALGFHLTHAGWHRVSEMAAYTAKTFASLVLGSFLASADRLLLGRLALPADFTNYTICTNAGARIMGIGGSIMGPVFHNTSRAVGRGSRDSIAAVFNEIFDFTFPWYTLLAIWVCLWHPVLLRLWLGPHLAASVAPLLVPIVLGCCLTAIGNISGAQLGPLNRVGTGLIFIALTCVALVVAVLSGWHLNGIIGVAWGFLFSRIVPFSQDLFVIQLTKAGGWLALKTWRHLATQIVVGMFFFFPTTFFVARSSYWQLIPTFLHGGSVAAWLLRKPVRGFLRSV